MTADTPTPDEIRQICADLRHDVAPYVLTNAPHVAADMLEALHADNERLRRAGWPLLRTTDDQIAHVACSDGTHVGVQITDAGITRATFQNIRKALSDDC